MTPTDSPPLTRAPHRWVYAEMLVFALISLFASFVLAIDAIELAADPNAQFSCDISATISCSKVGLSWQANLLGFPNAYLGLMAEPVVITLAVAGLSGVLFPRWIMLGAQIVYSVGFVFAYWLFFQSYFVIGALCPWCLTVTVATTFVMFSITRINLLDNNFGLPPRAHAAVSRWLRIGVDFGLLAIILAGIAAAILSKYL
jgi:uncharacterized membrane protein